MTLPKHPLGRLAPACALALAGAAWPLSPAVAGTPTTNYAFSKPAVAADADTWGTQLNADLDSLDAILFGKLDKVGGTMTGTIVLTPGTTLTAPLKFQAGALLSSPVAHAEEWDGSHLWVTQSAGPTRKQLAFIDDAITGSAAKWTTARSFTFTGDATGSAASVDGSAAVSIAMTGVQAAKWTTPRSFTFTGDATGSAASVDGSANVSIAMTGVQAAKWTTGRTITLTGAVTGVSGAFDGSAALSFATTLAAGQAVSNLGFTPANVAGDTFTGKLNTKASATGAAGFNIAPGVAPTSPSNGDCWLTSTAVLCQVGGSSVTLATTSGAVTSYNGRIGAVTPQLTDVTTALGYTPANATGITGILKATAGVVSQAVSSSDYAPPTATSSALKGNGSGGFAAAACADLTNGATGCSTATGTSGAVIPLLNGSNTWGAKQTLFSATTAAASANIPSGAAPTSPAAGDLWSASNLLFHRSNTTTKQLAYIDDAITGSAAKLTTGRTIAITGDVAYTSPSFDGSGNVTASATLATTGVGAATYGDSLNIAQVALDAKGRATTASNVAIATMGGDLGSGGTKGLVPAPATGDANKALTGAGTFQPVAARAWGQFTGSTATLNTSYGVTSVSRSGPGNYVITFNFTWSSSSYACTATARRPGGAGAFIIVAGDTSNAPTTTTWPIVVQNTSGAQDADVMFVCFGA